MRKGEISLNIFYSCISLVCQNTVLSANGLNTPIGFIIVAIDRLLDHLHQHCLDTTFCSFVICFFPPQTKF